MHIVTVVNIISAFVIAVFAMVQCYILWQQHRWGIKPTLIRTAVCQNKNVWVNVIENIGTGVARIEDVFIIIDGKPADIGTVSEKEIYSDSTRWCKQNDRIVMYLLVKEKANKVKFRVHYSDYEGKKQKPLEFTANDNNVIEPLEKTKDIFSICNEEYLIRNSTIDLFINSKEKLMFTMERVKGESIKYG